VPHPDEVVLEELACSLLETWKLDAVLARKVAATLMDFERETRLPIQVISGFRTDREQLALGRAGRPAAPINLSNHTICPARAVDVRIGGIPTTTIKAIFGRIASMNGLRWGGGSPIDPKNGVLPTDWQHLDLGPRARA